MVFSRMAKFKINFNLLKSSIRVSKSNMAEMEMRLSLQESIYCKYGLNRDAGLSKLNRVLMDVYGINYDETANMWSEHLVLFASISESTIPISRILEIGTFDGETTKIISLFFPDSEILTIDLPKSELTKIDLYKYMTELPSFENKRAQNIAQSQKIRFQEMNSLQLSNSLSQFDLIWIDGDHSYPIAAIDIANSLRLLSENGIAVCDDVYVDSQNKNSPGRSICSYETLNKFADAKLLSFSLIRKRLGVQFNSSNANEKFLGIFQKIT